MVATFQVEPSEMETFFGTFRRAFSASKVKVTVEPVAETQEETNKRILQTLAAENSGDPPYKVIAMEELEEMVK